MDRFPAGRGLHRHRSTDNENRTRDLWRELDAKKADMVRSRFAARWMAGGIFDEQESI